MSQRKLEFVVDAVAEIEFAADWYRARSPKSAKRFLQAVDAAIKRITENPELCPPYILGTRRYLLRRFP